MCSELCDRVTGQLDSLVIFMGLREQRFFNEATRFWGDLGGAGDPELLPASPQAYEQIILQSALLLGVAYAEAYLADALREVIRAQPKVLTSRKKNLTWEDAVTAGDYATIMNMMIERELLEFTHQTVDGMLRYVQDNLKLSLPDEYERRLKSAAPGLTGRAAARGLCALWNGRVTLLQRRSHVFAAMDWPKVICHDRPLAA